MVVVRDCLVERLALARAGAPRDRNGVCAVEPGLTWEVAGPVLTLVAQEFDPDGAPRKVIAAARRELFSTVGWCPLDLVGPLQEEEVSLVLAAALLVAHGRGGDILALHEAGGIFYGKAPAGTAHSVGGVLEPGGRWECWVEEAADGEASGWVGAAYVGPAGDWCVDDVGSQGGWSDGEGSQECDWGD
jgi:hypothetical protein